MNALLALTLPFVVPAQGDLARHVYPLSDRLSAPPVVIDVSDFPESRAWGEAAKALVTSWYGGVTELLATKDFKSPRQIKLVIKREISAPAWASGDTITISGKWITEHPDDLGMVIHELVHVVQQYPDGKNKPGWLVEGIADYVRWWRYEPEAPRPRIDFGKASYRDSYRTTAAFLAWASRTHDMRLVPALDGALRKGEDPMPEFKRLTGKTVDELWTQFSGKA